MMINRMVRLIICLLIISTGSIVQAAPRLDVDNIEVNFNNKTGYPVEKDGLLLVPIRILCENMGYCVAWQEKDKVIISGNSKKIIFYVESNKVIIDNREEKLNIKAQVINNRLYAPVRLIGEITDRNISWNGTNKIMYIETKKEDKEKKDIIAIISSIVVVLGGLVGILKEQRGLIKIQDEDIYMEEVLTPFYKQLVSEHTVKNLQIMKNDLKSVYTCIPYSIATAIDEANNPVEEKDIFRLLLVDYWNNRNNSVNNMDKIIKYIINATINSLIIGFMGYGIYWILSNEMTFISVIEELIRRNEIIWGIKILLILLIIIMFIGLAVVAMGVVIGLYLAIRRMIGGIDEYTVIKSSKVHKINKKKKNKYEKWKKQGIHIVVLLEDALSNY